MRTDFERAYVTAQGHVAILTMNHPEVRNAASPSLVEGVIDALEFIQKPDSGFRAIVLTGEGKGFCSGANLTEGRPGKSRGAGQSLETIYHPLMRRLRECKLPIVTAVNGAAAGVGMSIALVGDLIYASKSAFFLQAFVNIGLVPDGGSTWLLPRMIGLARARELSMLGERLPAAKALEWGLINKVFDDAALMEEAIQTATKLANGPTLALGMIRELYTATSENGFEDQINMERAYQQIAGQSADNKEGIKAFQEKRPAKFTGK